MDPVHPAFHLALAAALATAALTSRAAAGSRGARRGGRWFTGADCLLVIGLLLEAAALGVGALGGGVAAWLAALGGIAGEGTLLPHRAMTLQPHVVASLHTAAAAFALAWPALALRGARRFFARGRSSVPPWSDGAVFAGVALAVVVAGNAALWIDAGAVVLAPTLAVWCEPGLAAGAGAAVLLAWLAFALTRLRDFDLHPACRTLAITAAVAATAAAAVVGIDWVGAVSTGRGAVASGAVPFAVTGLLALAATHLRLAMNHARDIEHLRDNERKLKAMADVDALTGLPNRRHFHELATRAVEQTAASATSTVLLFDVDGMKRVNALLGQVTGDEALAQVGTTLRETLRRRDVAGRIGDDEFAVLLPRTRVDDAATVIARIHARVADRQVAPRIAPVRLHVGTAEIRPGQSLAETLRKAELSLEAARDTERRKLAAAAAESADADKAPAPSRSAATVRGTEGVPPEVVAVARSLQRAADAVPDRRAARRSDPVACLPRCGGVQGRRPLLRRRAATTGRSQSRGSAAPRQAPRSWLCARPPGE
jgi:diguanylate cyclase (GGDEF)-like protein